MPFTLAHPAAVLPIRARWRWLALAPLVVGSMVPDAGYYLPLPDSYKLHAHTWLGAFSFSLPAGLALLLIFYWIAPELVYLLPNPHREALQPFSKAPALSARNALVAACGIVIGAETHVAWDSFTHSDGWMVQRFPLLHVAFGIHPYFILQVLSSVAGVWFVLHVYDQWAIRQSFRAWTWQDSSWRSYFWIGLLAACFIAAAVESHTVQVIASLYFLYSRHFALILMTSFIRDFLVSLCAAAMSLKILGRRTRLGVAY